MDLAVALEEGSGGALGRAGAEGGQGHPRVLRLVAIYQPVSI